MHEHTILNGCVNMALTQDNSYYIFKQYKNATKRFAFVEYNDLPALMIVRYLLETGKRSFSVFTLETEEVCDVYQVHILRREE
jgi:hypothetical protein